MAGKKKPEGISIRAYSIHRGCSDTAVHKAIKATKIVAGLIVRPGKSPLIIPDVADAEWKDNVNPNYDRTTQSGKPVFADGEEPIVTSQATKQDTSNLAAAKKYKAVFDAKLAELDYRKKAGELVDRDAINKRLFSAGQEMRDALLVIPDRVVDDMLAAPSRNDAHKILHEAIAAVLDQMASVVERKLNNNEQN